MSQTSVNCPVCEYENDLNGMPVWNNASYTCLNCGTVWKELGHKPSTTRVSYSNQSTANAVIDNRVFNKRHYTKSRFSQNARTTIDYETVKTSKSRFWQTGLVGAFSVCSALLLISLGLHFWYQNLQDDVLQIADVTLDHQQNSLGDSVITVTGILENLADQTRPVRPIAITLKNGDGKKVMHWVHRTSLATLSAGSNGKFKSSIAFTPGENFTVEAKFL